MPNKQAIRWVVVLTALLVGGFIAVTLWSRPLRLLVRNESGRTLDRVTITYDGGQATFESLAHGAEEVLRLRPATATSVHISWEAGNQVVAKDLDVYLEPAYAGLLTAVVLESFEVQVIHDVHPLVAAIRRDPAGPLMRVCE